MTAITVFGAIILVALLIMAIPTIISFGTLIAIGLACAFIDYMNSDKEKEGDKR